VLTWASWLPAWVRSNGGCYIHPKHGWVLGRRPYLEANAEALQFLADLIVKYGAAPAVAGKCQLGDKDAFAAGKLAMLILGRWAVTKLKLINNFRWGISEIPKSPRTGKRESVLFTAGYAISRKSRRKEQACQLVKYLLSPEAQRKAARSGIGIPSRRSIAYSRDFLHSPEINRNQKKLGNLIDHSINIRALSYSQVPPSHRNWLSIRARLNQWLQPGFMGSRTMKDIIESRQPNFEKLMEQ